VRVVPPWGLMEMKNFFQKSSWIVTMVAITKASAPAVATSGGEDQNKNGEKFPPPKAKGKTRDKVAAFEGVSGRTLGTAMAAGGSSAWSRAFRCTQRVAINLSRPGAKTPVCFPLGIRLIRAPAANTFPLTLHPWVPPLRAVLGLW
jgi:hypothetical protein